MDKYTVHHYTCPVCGYLVFDEKPGSYGICPICGWEDDNSQLRWPTMDGGANKESLVEAQNNFLQNDTKNNRGKDFLRDPQWHPLKEEQINTLQQILNDLSHSGIPWPDDPTQLYWWREDFWLNTSDKK